MSNFQIIEQQDGRFALYQGGVLINIYTRKSSAVRRMKKLEQVVDNQVQDLRLNEECDERLIKLNQLLFTLEEKFLLLDKEFSKGSSIAEDAKDGRINVLENSSKSIPEVISNFLINIYLSSISWMYGIQSGAQPHALTQRVERGAERGVARSPPLANRGGAEKNNPIIRGNIFKT